MRWSHGLVRDTCWPIKLANLSFFASQPLAYVLDNDEHTQVPNPLSKHLILTNHALCLSLVVRTFISTCQTPIITTFTTCWCSSQPRWSVSTWRPWSSLQFIPSKVKRVSRMYCERWRSRNRSAWMMVRKRWCLSGEWSGAFRGGCRLIDCRGMTVTLSTGCLQLLKLLLLCPNHLQQAILLCVSRSSANCSISSSSEFEGLFGTIMDVLLVPPAPALTLGVTLPSLGFVNDMVLCLW